MDLGAVGPGPASTSLSRVTGSIPPAAQATASVAAGNAGTLGDSVSILPDDLSAPDIARLIDLSERALPDQDTAQPQELLLTFISAAAESDATRALNALSEIVALDPSRPEILRTDPAIAPIRASVDQFVDRQTTIAKLDAEGRLEQAAQEIGASASAKLTGWDMPPGTMVEIATRIFDSGGLANYVRAAELAQAVIDGSRCAPGVVSLPMAAPESHDAAKQPGGMARLTYLWLRAPC